MGKYIEHLFGSPFCKVHLFVMQCYREKGRERVRERKGEKDIFHLLAYFPNVIISFSVFGYVFKMSVLLCLHTYPPSIYFLPVFI